MPGSTSTSRVLHWIVAIIVLAFLGSLLRPGVHSGPRHPTKRTQCRNNLKQISNALHHYHDRYGCFPPAYVADEAGRPMHSWRVLILPWLDQQLLYDLYRFDEPWNGPNNSKLATQSLPVFQCPTDFESRESKEHWTSYVAIVGPHTMWPEDRCVSVADVPDGTGLTLHVAEIRRSGIHWMEPRDLHIAQMAPTINASGRPGISSFHTDAVIAAFADGSNRVLSDKLSPEFVRRLIDRDDGGPTSAEEF